MKSTKRIWAIVLSLVIALLLLPFFGTRVQAATNPYGKYQDVDGDGYSEIRCTWYAWQKAYDVCGVALPGWGNAKTWLASAQNAGYATGSEPHINSIAVFNTGTYGHVSFVTAVHGDTMTVEEGGNRELDHTASQGVGISHPSCVVGVGGLIGFIYLDPSQLYANLGDDFYAVILETKYWKPISLNTDTHLVTLETETGTANQKWHFVRQSDGAYVIASCYDGNVLEMTNGERVNGTQLSATWTDWGGACQRWYLYQQGDGYLFKNKHYPDEEWVMNLDNNSSSNGTKVSIQTKNGSEAQIFSVYKGNDVQLNGPTLSCSVSNGKATFTWNRTYGAKRYDLKIWKNKIWEGDAYYIGNDVTSGTTVELEAGTYQAYIDAVDFFQFQMGNVVEFTVEKPQLPKQGWYSISGKKYFYVNGVVKTKWHNENGKWYYLDPDDGGAMATGIRKVGNASYYMDKDGIMQTGWINDAGNWYYAQSSGALATGWLKSGTAWYYLDPSTFVMKTGWVKVGDTWYYMASSGAMQTGWLKVGGTWYFFKSSGAMAASEWVPGYYWISASGAWTYQPVGSWKKDSTGWWFGDTSGWYAKNTTIKIDNVNYTFDSSGYWVE